MIPCIIHTFWFGQKAIPKNVKKYIESWRKNNPGYQIKIWTEKNYDVNKNKYSSQAYKKSKYAFVSDYARLEILYKYGGIYLDTDILVCKSFDNLLEKKAFIGYQNDLELNTGVIGAEKNNKWIGQLLKLYDDRQFINLDGSIDLTTNVEIITEYTNKIFKLDNNKTIQEFSDLTVYPFEYFCAKSLVDGKIYKTHKTYAIHEFSGSWLSSKDKFVKWLINAIGYNRVQKLVKIKNFFKWVRK